MNLPVYQVALGENNLGITGISLVKKPATESKFIYFSKDEEEPVQPKFYFADAEKGEVLGAILVPDKPIFRNMNGEQFYVSFSKQVISDLNERMQETGFNKFFTVDHSLYAGQAITFLESWIKETEQDKSVAFGINEPIGTLFVKARVNTDFLKENIKDGELAGFSVELNADIIKTNLTEEKMDFKTIYEKSIKVDKGVELIFNGDIKVGTVLFSVDESDENKPKLLPYSGKFTVEQKEYTVTDGLVTGFEDKELTLMDKINDLVSSINDMKSAIAEIKGVAPEENDFSEKIDGIMTKLEEQRLLTEQSIHQITQTDKTSYAEEEMHFDADSYRVASDWIKKFNK